jgi:hypothetical protein
MDLMKLCAITSVSIFFIGYWFGFVEDEYEIGAFLFFSASVIAIAGLIFN